MTLPVLGRGMLIKRAFTRNRPTLLSLNRFERKKNAALAISAFALLKAKFGDHPELKHARLVIAGESSHS
jgi:alpha-1,3/alpha-1,6-mannosyltransferase